MLTKIIAIRFRPGYIAGPKPWAREMPYYRLYFHNRFGKFERAEEVDVADDAAALRRAREIDHAHCIEVWQQARRVGIVEPADNSN